MISELTLDAIDSCLDNHDERLDWQDQAITANTKLIEEALVKLVRLEMEGLSPAAQQVEESGRHQYYGDAIHWTGEIFRDRETYLASHGGACQEACVWLLNDDLLVSEEQVRYRLSRSCSHLMNALMAKWKMAQAASEPGR